MIDAYAKLKNAFTVEQLFAFDYQKPSVYNSETVEKTIYNHYKNYRITAMSDDTEEMEEWLEDFQARIEEIMPYYSKLFDSADLIIDPLKNVDLKHIIESDTKVDTTYSDTKTGKEDITRTDELAQTTQESVDNTRSDATSAYTNVNKEDDTYSSVNGFTETENTNQGETTSKFSNTPQGSVANLEDNGYLTNVTLNDGTTKDTGNVSESSEQTGNLVSKENGSSVSNTNVKDNTEHSSTVENTGTQKTEDNTTLSSEGSNNKNIDLDVTNTKTGYNGISAGKLMEEYRATIIDINSKLLNSIADLFMQIW